MPTYAEDRMHAESNRPPRRLDRDAADRVLRRAIELGEQAESGHEVDGLDEQALVQAAEELGMDPTSVHLAVAEERLGILRDRQAGRLDRLAGPAVVTASALVERHPEEMLDTADRWLRRHGALRRAQRDDSAWVTTYSRRTDVLAGVQRSVRSFMGREHLGRIRRLQVGVAPVGENRCTIALIVDVSIDRHATVAAGSSIAAVGSAASAALALTEAAPLLLGVPLSVGAGLAVLRWRAMTMPDLERTLDGVLARIIADESEPTLIAEVRERIRSQRPRPATK